MEDRMAESDLAVVGAVIASESFYNAFGEIYTMHQLRVDRMAGPMQASVAPPDTMEFFTMGGVINEEQLIVYPSLRDINDAQGVFLLKEYTGSRVISSGATLYRPTAVHESVMPFNPETGTFSDGDNLIGDIDDVNALVSSTMGNSLTNVSGRDWLPQHAVNRSMMPSIGSLSPLNFSAGIGDVLTINGNGFGSTAGNVFFDSPDDGPGGSFTGAGSDDIISWTGNQIRVRVVSNAGSGRVIVRTAAGQQTNSGQSIDVDFAITNLTLSNGNITTPLLIDDEADGNGGYAFAVGNSSANGGESLADNAAAFASLNRAVSTWQTEGDYSVYLEGTTSIQQPSRTDNVNIVAFGSNAYDFDVELGSGTVGIAFSYFNACGSSEFEVTGMDVLFRRNGNPNGTGGSVNYNYGPGNNGGTDFESVALHEFGHTHQLKHVADPSEVMSFRITSGQNQRNISTDTRSGADFIADLSGAYDPPLINCGGDFAEIRDYLTFSEAGGQVLPVEWLAFRARPTEKTVVLDWSTASETANNFFAVERSVNGTDFTEIGRRDAPEANQSGGTYTLTDNSPLSGTSYYRVTQIDLSGARSYTNVEEVTFHHGTDLSAYPNPVINFLNVTTGYRVAATTYRLSDMTGRTLRNVSVGSGNSPLRIDVSGLAAGQYVLSAEDGRVLRFVR